MNREEILAELSDVFRDVFDNDEIILNYEITSEDIDGWDSLMHITLISEIEHVFNLTFDMKEILDMNNVGELISIIERKTTI